MFLKTICLSFLPWIALASFGNADTIISLNPSLENTVVQTSGTAQLSNALGDVYVGRTNQDGQGPATISIRRGLIEFNVAGSIPAGATITGGTLTMNDVMGLNGNQTLTLYDMLDSWGQGTSNTNGGMGAPATNNDATWLYRFYNASNPSASVPWTTPGGDFSSTPSGAATDYDTGLGTNPLVIWSSPQMAADIQSWLNDPATDYGWLLQGNESAGQTAKRLDGMFEASNVAPTLTISYAVPEPTTICLAVSGLLVMALVKAQRFRKRRI